MFNGKAFLTATFPEHQNVPTLFCQYGFQPPNVAAVSKWFQRGNVPGPWLAMILALLELEQGAPVSISRFIVMGEPHGS